MVGHGAKFTQKTEQAIAALLSHKSVEDAAHAMGIGTNTLQRWMKDPQFEEALRGARASVLAQAIHRLQAASGAAATTLLKLMLDPNAPAGIRLRAAESVLEQATKATDLEDLQHRVAKLERKVSSHKSSRQAPRAVTFLKAVPALPPAPTEARTTPRHDGVATEEGADE